MNPEKQRLIQDLLPNEGEHDRRQATLRAGNTLLRRRRRRNVLFRSVTVLAAVICIGFSMRSLLPTISSTETVTIPPTTPTLPQAQSLTDDELLSLFPDAAVALATVNGKPKLIFLNPEDEARYVQQF